MKIIYTKSVSELPVAVRVVDPHGVVVAVRMTPLGGALLHQVTRSKGNKRAIEEEWPSEMHHMVKDIVAPRRVFLDDVTDQEIVTYCKKGEHNVEISVVLLREKVAMFKASGMPQKLVI